MRLEQLTIGQPMHLGRLMTFEGLMSLGHSMNLKQLMSR